MRASWFSVTAVAGVSTASVGTGVGEAMTDAEPPVHAVSSMPPTTSTGTSAMRLAARRPFGRRPSSGREVTGR